MISILILNHQRLVGAGWASFFAAQPGIRVLAETADPDEARRIAIANKPRIIVAYSDLALHAGINELRGLHKACPSSRTILVTLYYPGGILSELMRLGVRSCLSRDSSLQDMLTAVARVSVGNTYLSTGPWTGSEPDKKWNPLPGLARLTPRELQVASLLGKGKTSKEAAALLHMSYKTVEVHRHHILKKLECRNTIQLAHLLTNTQFDTPTRGT